MVQLGFGFMQLRAIALFLLRFMVYDEFASEKKI